MFTLAGAPLYVLHLYTAKCGWLHDSQITFCFRGVGTMCKSAYAPTCCHRRQLVVRGSGRAKTTCRPNAQQTQIARTMPRLADAFRGAPDRCSMNYLFRMPFKHTYLCSSCTGQEPLRARIRRWPAPVPAPCNCLLPYMIMHSEAALTGCRRLAEMSHHCCHGACWAWRQLHF